MQAWANDKCLLVRVYSAITAIALLVLVSCLPAAAQSFQHPGILNSRTDLQTIRAKLNAGAAPWQQAFAALKASPYASLQYKATPFVTVECGSYNNPNVGCNQQVEDAMTAYCHALLWWLTGKKAHAEKAKDIINAWSATYQKNTASNARLVVSWTAPWLVNAAELLRYSAAGWTEQEQAAFAALLQKFLPYILDDSMPGNNWVLSAIEAHLAIAVYTDDRPLFDKGIDRWKQRVVTYIYQRSDGDKPVASPGKTDAQTAAIWKTSGAGLVDGLAMETCRDLGHLNLGFKSMMYGAQTAWLQGVDLFGLEQKRLSDFMELHGGWMTGSNEVPPTICAGKIIAKRADTIGVKPPLGGGQAAWEVAYSHLHHRLGIALPFTRQMLQANRPAKIARWVAKGETLTHAHLFSTSTKHNNEQTNTQQ